VTGRWAGAKIGLRRQAELVKLAKQHDIEELLPPGRKSSVFKQSRLLERGLRVKGTGEGEKVKGHKWERHMGATLDKRRTAMENMPEIIREWKQVREIPYSLVWWLVLEVQMLTAFAARSRQRMEEVSQINPSDWLLRSFLRQGPVSDSLWFYTPAFGASFSNPGTGHILPISPHRSITSLDFRDTAGRMTRIAIAGCHQSATSAMVSRISSFLLYILYIAFSVAHVDIHAASKTATLCCGQCKIAMMSTHLFSFLFTIRGCPGNRR
jgi:hypothetical protein